MSITNARFALNPLQYFATADGWLDSTLAPPLPARLGHIARAGFTAVQSEVPVDMTAASYKQLLVGYGIEPGPGYVSLAWSDNEDERNCALERAVELARDNVALGTPLLFLSMGMDKEADRVAHPAIGYGSTPELLKRVRDYLATAADLITREGGVAALHPHVGSWIETADETRYVLDTIDESILKFGPDVGHIAWTGINPTDIVRDYSQRVAGIHVKDFKADIAERSRTEGWDYRTTAQAGIWTEPDVGDMNFDALFEALPDAFNGWVVIEVDRGTTPTPEESINTAGEWLGKLALSE